MPASSPQTTNAPDSSAPSALPPRSERTIPLVLGIDPGTRVMGYGAVAVTAEGPRLVAAGELRQDREGSGLQRGPAETVGTAGRPQCAGSRTLGRLWGIVLAEVN